MNCGAEIRSKLDMELDVVSKSVLISAIVRLHAVVGSTVDGAVWSAIRDTLDINEDPKWIH